MQKANYNPQSANAQDSANNSHNSAFDSNLDSANRAKSAKKDEFSKLKLLALELKNMQLRLVKDLNSADFYKQNNAIKLN